MTIAHNTMALRGQPLPPVDWLRLGTLLHYVMQEGPVPAWYYDDQYDDPDPNEPTFYEAMMTGDLE